ncbi:hypothetical protein [Rubrimonas cliftonensis]|uniref:Uncharacterized protein n=1 Tax=Rubrimonas cliftonensis TaxID=89524 RepID=A0A1H3W0M4_9RHOB|nr:hypothetical protein [Rubrimonas cliftonensis]SDZ79994.1 hypothetical protein SAMN05444370_101414 [Rubrimonas cliftonensis]
MAAATRAIGMARSLLRLVSRPLRWLLTALSALRSATLAALLIVSLAVSTLSVTLGILSFTSSAFVGAVSSLASRAGLTTVQASQRALRGRIARQVAQRSLTGVARSLTGVATQSAPFVGVAAVAGLTAWEISDYCATIEDMRALDPDAAEPGACEAARGAAADLAALASQMGLTAPPQADSPEDAHSGEP